MQFFLDNALKIKYYSIYIAVYKGQLMASIGTGINALRSLVFVRNSGKKVISNTSIKVRNKSGSIKRTGINTNLSPKRIKFATSKFLIKVQKNRSPQDRFIDILAWVLSPSESHSFSPHTNILLIYGLFNLFCYAIVDICSLQSNSHLGNMYF